MRHTVTNNLSCYSNWRIGKFQTEKYKHQTRFKIIDMEQFLLEKKIIVSMLYLVHPINRLSVAINAVWVPLITKGIKLDTGPQNDTTWVSYVICKVIDVYFHKPFVYNILHLRVVFLQVVGDHNSPQSHVFWNSLQSFSFLYYIRQYELCWLRNISSHGGNRKYLG